MLDRLAGEGRVPTFARLRHEGAFGTLRSREPLVSPIVWTTIATGRKAEDHGIFDFLEISKGEAVPISSARRRVAALWNVAAEFGKRSGFVGWYASYPSEHTLGFQVSDRIGFHQVKSATAEIGTTYPEALAGELRSSHGTAAPDLQATRRRFLRDPSAALSDDGQKRLDQLAKLYATSELYRRIVPELQRRYHTDVLGVYFEIVDGCGHLFIEDAPPRRPDVTDQDFAAFSDTVDRCYEYQDEVVGELLGLEGPDTLTLIVSDHGFKSGELRPKTSGRADTGLATLWHRLDGVILAHGGPVRAGATISGATILDVAPTVLAHLGVPLSKELPGRVLSDLFRPDRVPHTRSVARYAPPPPIEPPTAAAADPEAMERLRALGYLGGTSGRVTGGDDGRTAMSFLNEGSARTADSDYEGGLRAYGRAMELDPRNVNARVFASRIEARRGELDLAKTHLDRALALDPGNVNVRLQRASLALQAGQRTEAAKELEAAGRLDDRLPLFHLLTARIARADGRTRDAEEALARAEGLADAPGLLADIMVLRAQMAAERGSASEAQAVLARLPASPPAGVLSEVQGDVALLRGDPRAAIVAYEQARRERPSESVLERKLGDAQAVSGALPLAREAFERAITKARTDQEREGAYGSLSILHQKQGREDLALRALQDGTRQAPRSAALWGMLGAAYGRANRLDEALASYERSVALKPTALGSKTLAALLFERRGDRARAVRLWRQSIALDPNQPDVKRFLKQYGP